MQLRSRKKTRIESKLPEPDFYPPDLTVDQLRAALKERGIESKSLKLKADLVARLQESIASEKTQDRERRIQTLGSSHSDSKSSSSSSSSLSSSSSPQLSRIKHSGFHRLPAECIVDMSQYLPFKDVAALARCCVLLNSICSLKLKGHPSPALRLRKVFGRTTLNIKLTEKTAQRLFYCFSNLERFNCQWTVPDTILSSLLKSSARLRHLVLRRIVTPALLQQIFNNCSDLISLEAFLVDPDITFPLPILESLQTLTVFCGQTDLFSKLLAACPNLESLTTDDALECDIKKLVKLRDLKLINDKARDIAQFNSLRSLEISAVTLSSPSKFANLTELTLTDLQSCNWSLAEFPVLKLLDLFDGSENATVADFNSLLQVTPAVETLVLRFQVQLVFSVLTVPDSTGSFLCPRLLEVQYTEIFKHFRLADVKNRNIRAAVTAFEKSRPACSVLLIE